MATPVRVLAVALAIGGLFLAPSCRLFQAAAEAPGKVFGGGSKKDKTRPVQEVQTDVMRFADRLDATIVQTAHDMAQREEKDPRARMRSLAWSIPKRTAALTIASGPNPNLNLLDMLVLVTLGRMVQEERRASGIEEEDEDTGVTISEAFATLEADIWAVARKTLDEKKLAAIREVIETWHDENPEQRITTFVRLPNFERLLATNRVRDKNVFEELGSLLSLDPLAGLEPAKREVAEARLLGERTLFYAQRAPLIFSAQAELLGLRLANMPQVGDALDKSDRISKAAESLAETAAGLPEAIRSEREQISEALSKQRRELIQDLESAEAPLERLLSEYRTSAEATKEMSGAVKGAVESLDAFVARVNEPSTHDDPEEPGRPFDVREYGEAAAKIESAAVQVDGILEDLNRSQAEIAPLLDQASARLDHSVERAAAYALGVGVLLIGAGAGAALLVRRSGYRKP
jgi:exonuclease VII small subunit